MTRTLVLVLVFTMLNLSCKPSKKPILNYVGNAGFRRSYADHEHWSEAKLDSVEKSNPILMPLGDTTEPECLNILTEMGFTDKRELFISKVESLLKDTITITMENGSRCSAYINFNFKELKASLYLKALNSIDSVPIEWTGYGHGLLQKRLEPDQTSFILYLSHYYVMNGDNYEIFLYRVQ